MARGKSRMKRGGPMKPGRAELSRREVAARRVRLNRHGKRARAWAREWRTIKLELEKRGITRCERCGSEFFLTPAHSLKRRHITTVEEMREVALLCRDCHEFYELQGEAVMAPAIRAIIQRREVQV